LENWKKLLEEANGELEEKIKSLFLEGSEDCARERGGGVIDSKDVFVFGRRIAENVGRTRRVSSSIAGSFG
jgi:hypothetical protein